ncbi:hypothetical protein [Streptomyces capillispiralis]|uniref:Uncharacterized protein n=1 Tax=Streptomyces capillispiralis TaxID=68182 RepID=A0A561TFH9_9ACTN|nr:hypothetical protein [Streptomyces capillispiralis]TWF85874.1 hypothetical protein FHX78_112831 [Streptomyces capillispiralis]GHH89649.1 hypothetical protein GCM10017779_01620 [Streptomyces capillispiralis]
MGNSRAYPVFRTTDAAEAYRQAKRLCALLEHVNDRVWLFSEMRTPGEARRMALIVPGECFDYEDTRTDPVTGDFLFFESDVSALDDAELGTHLPLSFSEDVERGEDVEERFLAALGEGTAAIEWNGRWPDDPEIDSHGHWNHDGVQIVFHGDDAQYGKWAEDHTVFVHVTKYGDLERAQKLAAHIGSEVLGEAQLGW